MCCSLLFLFLVAIKELRPEVKIEARNSLGSALFCEITNDIVLSNYDLKALEDYMKELAAKSEPIIYKHINKKEAEKILCERNEADRLELLHAIDDDLLLTCYTLKGHMEYFFGPMLPDCGYLKLFELINYENGIVINYPETVRTNWMFLLTVLNSIKCSTRWKNGQLCCNAILLPS